MPQIIFFCLLHAWTAKSVLQRGGAVSVVACAGALLRSRTVHCTPTHMQVKGVSFNNEASGESRQELLRAAAASDPVLFAKEPDNPVDANAIAVISTRGQVGYVPAELTSHFEHNITMVCIHFHLSLKAHAMRSFEVLPHACRSMLWTRILTEAFHHRGLHRGLPSHTRLCWDTPSRGALLLRSSHLMLQSCTVQGYFEWAAAATTVDPADALIGASVNALPNMRAAHTQALPSELVRHADLSASLPKDLWSEIEMQVSESTFGRCQMTGLQGARINPNDVRGLVHWSSRT